MSWRLLSTDWALDAVLALLGDGSEDVYCLWLAAVDCGAAHVRDHLLLHSNARPLSMARARDLAIVHACWDTLTKMPAPPSRPQWIKTEDHKAREYASKRGKRQQQSWAAHLLYEAAKRGHLESVAKLHSACPYDQAVALEEAARNGRIDVVAWLLKTPRDGVVCDFNFDSDPVLDFCAWRVQRSTTAYFTLSKKWGLMKNDRAYSIGAMAASHGDLATVDRLFGHPIFKSSFGTRAIEGAALGGHVDILERLFTKLPREFANSAVFQKAMEAGNMEVAKWLLARRIRHEPVWAIQAAAVESGNIDAVRWVMANLGDSPFVSSSTMAKLAARGHEEMVRWLVEENRAAISLRDITEAMSNRHADLSKWMASHCVENVSSVSASLLREAATVGNSALAKWLVEELDLWDPLAFCTPSPSSEVMAYLHNAASRRAEKLRAPISQLLSVRERSWIHTGAFECVTWLLEHGYTDGFLSEVDLGYVLVIEDAHTANQRSFGRDTRQIANLRWTPSESTMRQLSKVVELIIKCYNPEFLRRINWLPTWAVRHGSMSSLKRLAEIGHPHLFTRRRFQLVLRETKNTSVVQWFLEQRPAFLSSRVIEWAIQYDKRQFLLWLFQRFLPQLTTLRNVARVEIHDHCLSSPHVEEPKLHHFDLLSILASHA